MARKRLSDIEISLAGLKRRGWTEGTIRKYLGAPDREWQSGDNEVSSTSTQYDYRNGIWSSISLEYSTTRKLNQRWNLARVLEVEAKPEVTTFLVMKKMSR